MQQMIDAGWRLASVPMISKLPHGACDFVHHCRIENALLIFRVERSGRQADLAHGGADIPDHPERVAFRIAFLDAAELAEESKKAAMTEHFGKHPIVEPALMPGKMAAEPHRRDDHPDNEEFADYENRLGSKDVACGHVVVHENGAERDEDRERREEVGEDISAAIEMRKMHCERI